MSPAHSANPPDGARIDGDGVWSQILRRGETAVPRPARGETAVPRPALFLDRDGVIVEDVGHLSRTADIRPIAAAADVIAAANRRAIPVVIVTNQSGIGRGMFGWPEFIDVQAHILDGLAAAGAAVDAVLACPHHPEGKPPYGHPDHPARKPNAAMLLRAAEQLRLDLSRSWIVGDRARDIAAGRNAGLAGALYVTADHGHHPDERASALAFAEKDRFRVLVGRTIRAALTRIPLLGGS
jgi:D-glycero-D-manno-heptose 1,7-bisphosphate phosphatase